VGLSVAEVKCSEDLSYRVSYIIRRHIDHMKFVAYMAFFLLSHSVIFCWLHFLNQCVYIWLYVLYASV